MGNAGSGSKPNDGTLQELFKGFVTGRMPAGRLKPRFLKKQYDLLTNYRLDKEGVVLGRRQALEGRILKAVYDSLGPLEDVQLVGFDDLDVSTSK